jgi:pimeloyl-ACP methyl ester carboxylesterase
VTSGETVVEVGGAPLSALVRRVPDPRAVIVALHGGSARSRYFHHPGPHRLSLLDTGAALGFSVVALDRPGYGASAPHADAFTTPSSRVGATYAALDELLGPDERDAGLFVLAHSAGCELAVRMAADVRGGALLGVEISGTGRRHHTAAEAVIDTTRTNGAPLSRPPGLRRLLWEPARLYPDGVDGMHFASPSPGYEGEVVAGWASRDFALLAPRVRVPVRYTLAEHEKVWANDPEAMSGIADLFTASPRVLTHLQRDGAHNLSVCVSAMAYHLGVLAFAEECAVARDQREHTRGRVR